MISIYAQYGYGTGFAIIMAVVLLASDHLYSYKIAEAGEKEGRG
jgi:hypothetical protein